MTHEESLMPPSPEFEKPILPWGGVTDPVQHNPDNFRYLVHGIAPGAKAFITLTNLMVKQSGGYDDEGLHGDPTVNLFLNPERVADRVSLSMSLIDQDHRSTWGNSGLIIEAPVDNVVLTSDSDVGAHNNSVDFLKHQAANGNLLNPEQLLAYTRWHTYNEVVGLAKTESGSLSLKGFYYKVKANGEPVEGLTVKKMQAHAQRLGLPVVEIKEVNPYPVDEIKDKDGIIHGVSVGGRHFSLESYGKTDKDKERDNFRVYDSSSISFMSPQDLATVIKFMEEQGVEPRVLDDLKLRYQEVDTHRQTAKIEFDDQGNVKNVKRRYGYGNLEIEESVGANGHGYTFNLTHERDRQDEVSLGNSYSFMREDDPRAPKVLHPDKVRELVEQAMLQLDPHKVTEVRKWLKNIMPTAEKAWHYEMQKRNRRSDFYHGRDIGKIPTKIGIADLGSGNKFTKTDLKLPIVDLSLFDLKKFEK